MYMIFPFKLELDPPILCAKKQNHVRYISVINLLETPAFSIPALCKPVWAFAMNELLYHSDSLHF